MAQEDALRSLTVGIIGVGRIGQVHLSTLRSLPFAKVAAIADFNLDHAKALADKFGISIATADPAEVVDHGEVEAVWICSPSQFHAEQIRLCADAGKHVFCEKPIGTSVEAAEEAVRYAKHKGIKLMTAMQRRFDPHFVRLKETATAQLGRPIQLKLTSRDPDPPPFSYVKGGGGLFKDMGIHDLDMTRFLLGAEPKEILAVGSCQIDREIEQLPGAEAFDTAVILIKFENGTTATIDLCRKAPFGYDQRAEFLGTDSCLTLDNVHASTVRKWSADTFGQVDNPVDFFMDRYCDAYTNETIAFARAVASNQDPPVTGRDGLIALIMADACALSAAQGKFVPVEIPPE